MKEEETLDYFRLKIKELRDRVEALERKYETHRPEPSNFMPVMMMMSLTDPRAAAIYRTLSTNPITSSYLAHPLAPRLFDEEKLKKDFGANDQFIDGDGESKWPMIVNFLIHSQIEKDLRTPDDPKILELKKLVEALKESGEEE